MRPLLVIVLMAGLGGCTGAYVAAGAATWVATEYVYDTPPLDYVAEFFDQSCEKHSIYDQPPRCRH